MATRYIRARTTECPACLARPGQACRTPSGASAKPHPARLAAEHEHRRVLALVAKMARLGCYVTWDASLTLTAKDMHAIHDIVETAWVR